MEIERNSISLAEKLTKYTPEGIKKTLLEGIYSYKCGVNKESRTIIIHISSEKLLQKSMLYEIENEIKEAYELSACFIMPHYRSELFSESYYSELITELKRNTALANGFFDDGKMELDGETLTFKLNGLGKIPHDAECASLIESIIDSEFGLDLTVEIENAVPFDMNAYVAESQRSIPMPVIPPKPEDTREVIVSLVEDSAEQEKADTEAVSTEEKTEEGIVTSFHSGFIDFDLSEKTVIYGKARKKENEIITITKAFNVDDKKIVSICGKIFFCDSRETRSGDKTIATVQITDEKASISVKFFCPTEVWKDAKGALKPGGVIQVVGHVTFDEYEKDTVMKPITVYKISAKKRMDDAEEKRVELHIHSQLSAMDAVIPPADIVSTAHAWGHRAVAITDHGNVQGFPDAMLAADKLGMKVIYGLEAYFVDDTARAVYGESNASFEKDTFIIFDIETTGLSALTCGITEIGAVRYRAGKVEERFNTFV
ncbi:MAG: PHP domain-containing protein, partial [Clostridia bacterium]|nr:PHP domain-containing protein [Clostridia bacterium]